MSNCSVCPDETTPKKAGEVSVVCAEPNGWLFSTRRTDVSPGIEELELSAESPAETTPPAFTVKFEIPKKGVQHVWHPFEERFPCCWTDQASSLCSGLPVRANFDDSENNTLTFAVSDALHALSFRTDVGMDNGNRHILVFATSFFGEAAPPRKSYAVRFRIDMRKVFWSDAVSDAVAWILETAGIRPAVPPPCAWEPPYSSWYVFRQTVSQAALDPEIERAAALGMKAVILDDGWQTDRGAWGVNEKFPDLKAQVDKAHALGMKYLLWFGLPHVSADSPMRKQFDGKYIDDKPDCWGLYNLDPRYPDVRAHLVKRLTDLVRDYGLDGFKLDFIDQFVARDPDPAAAKGFAGCDTVSVPLAAQRLLSEIYAGVTTAKPDAMIEFRQRYVGPLVRQYGHMLRANDCPADYEANRYRTLALRITSAGSAVHSDMLMWRTDDTPEEVKRQVWNVIFSVVQYSAFLGDLPPAHLAAIRETIDFAKAHRETLLFGKLTPHRPDLGYPLVEAESGAERIVAVYAPEFIAKLPGDGKRTILVNATTVSSLVVEDRRGLRRIGIAPSATLALD